MKPSFALVCLIGFGLSARAAILDHWTTQQVSTNHFGLTQIVHAQNRFVAAGWYSDYGAILTSENGFDWTVRSDGNGSPASGLSYVTRLEYAGNRFFALGGFGISAQSTNGLNWNTFGIGSAGSFMGVATSIAAGNGLYVCVGDAPLNTTFAVFTSPDAQTWTGRNANAPINAGLQDVAFGANRFVALGRNNGLVDNAGYVHVSFNGINWIRSGFPGGGSITFGKGIFIVPHAAGTNLLSVDGVNWTPSSTGLASMLGKVFLANGQLLARAGNQLVTSSNGVNWVAFPGTAPGGSFATDGRRMVTVGNTPGNALLSFNSYVHTSELLLELRLSNSGSPHLQLSGWPGRTYRVEFVEWLPAGPDDWQPLQTLQLPGPTVNLADPVPANTARRFYRGVLLP